MFSSEQEQSRKPSRAPRPVRRGLAAAALTLAAAGLGLVAPGSASAAPQAWECGSGNLCAYTGGSGNGSRCSWSNADPDWYSGSIQCSWSDNQNVGSAKNSGTSSAYDYVILFTGANYTGTGYCIAQNGDTWANLNVRIRSHRWEADC
ncbi:peptidase inhibitor family I36 protein [Streptomyces sp. NPDC014892]|uniref:peptidase inhibitor family I36 protein n=1 Tax=Streptomyces TaxID=1883 RepID=UPI001EFAA874|nr:peptidase inhibitor family I36 protein [Streptomyces deccanensis]ULR54250.1 peptidase inhibitor family I36 protein [Streptomyces deccanensis]